MAQPMIFLSIPTKTSEYDIERHTKLTSSEKSLLGENSRSISILSELLENNAKRKPISQNELAAFK
jgi:hypothetical protein